MQHQHIKHIFFDLDHTIWDFDLNAKETLLELYHEYELKLLGLNNAEEFINTYTENNHRLWEAYHLGKISKETLRQERFKSTFVQLGINPNLLPTQFENDYVNRSPSKTNLFDGAKTVLTYLQSKYSLHLISNGFKETTLTKMEVCGLNPYFLNVIIAEDVGVNKPDKAIFEHALNQAKANKKESIMIGDSLAADVYGALNFGMAAIYFNPLHTEKPDDVPLQITHLAELMELF